MPGLNSYRVAVYSTWFDVFNLIQLGIQALALLEGLLEHRLIKQNREAESLLLNKHWAIFIIFGAYPVVTISILLYGAGMHLVAYALAAVSLPAMTVVAITSFRRKSLAGKVHRRKLAKLLSETGFDSDGFEVRARPPLYNPPAPPAPDEPSWACRRSEYCARREITPRSPCTPTPCCGLYICGFSLSAARP